MSNDEFSNAESKAKRLRLGINILVMLCATASSVFLFYVLITIAPNFGASDDAGNVPTSEASPTLKVLQGKDDEVFVEIRDIDTAVEYSKSLSDQMERDLGISSDGQLALMFVQNDSDKPITFDVRDSEIDGFRLRILSGVSDRSKSSAVGKMRLLQSNPKFTLGVGESRELYVFLEGNNARIETAKSGIIELAATRKIKLTTHEYTLKAES